MKFGVKCQTCVGLNFRNIIVLFKDLANLTLSMNARASAGMLHILSEGKYGILQCKMHIQPDHVD
jgi:hypothetical protein